MNCLLIVLASIVGTPIPAEEEPFWVDDYGAALEATIALQKPLLIVIDDSAQSNGQSLHLEAEQEKKNVELLENYVLCRVDVTTEYGKRVADAFEVNQYPHTAIIDKTGARIIYRKTGQLDDSAWLSALKTHVRGESRTACRSAGGRSSYT